MFSQARVDYPWRWEGVTPSTGYGNSGRGIYFSLLWLDIGAGSITHHNPLIILNQALVSFLSFFLSFFSSFFFCFVVVVVVVFLFCFVFFLSSFVFLARCRETKISISTSSVWSRVANSSLTETAARSLKDSATHSKVKFKEILANLFQRSESGAQRSDGGERVKSYAAVVSPCFFPSSISAPALHYLNAKNRLVPRGIPTRHREGFQGAQQLYSPTPAGSDKKESNRTKGLFLDI